MVVLLKCFRCISVLVVRMCVGSSFGVNLVVCCSVFIVFLLLLSCCRLWLRLN